jgi:hypothetical protein
MNYKKLMSKVDTLCGPAYLYFGVSVVIMILVVVQNLMKANMKKLCFGPFSCNVGNVIIFFIIKFISVIFWTIILDALCKYGLGSLSWFLVLFPYIIMFVLFISNQ